MNNQNLTKDQVITLSDGRICKVVRVNAKSVRVNVISSTKTRLREDQLGEKTISPTLVPFRQATSRDVARSIGKILKF